MNVVIGTRAVFNGSVRIPPAWFEALGRVPDTVLVHVHENGTLVLVDDAIPEDQMFEWMVFCIPLGRRVLSGKIGNQRVLALPKPWFEHLGMVPPAVRFTVLGPGLLQAEPATVHKVTI